MILRKLKGKYRLFFGLCPECNSDAPKLDTCKVCDSYRTSYEGMPCKGLKQTWWNKFIKL